MRKIKKLKLISIFMKLLSLKLLHYRRFRQEEIVFKDDFSLIFWKNWAGKSSILDAIWYALFGPSSKDFVRVNRDFLRSYFLTDREPSKIELNFQYWMWNYRIVRIIDAGTKKFASNFIQENKDILVWPSWLEIIGWDEITSYISELLWVNKETFLRSVFARQKDLEVLSWWLSERKELINKVLGLDRIENIIFEMKKEEKEKKTLLEIYKKKVSDFDEESIKKEKKEIWEKKLELEKTLKLKQEELEILNKDFLWIKWDFDREDKKRTDFLNISSQINSLKSRGEFFTKQNEKNISDLALLKEKISVLEKKFWSDFLKKLKQEEEKLEKLTQNREKILKQKIELENKISYLRKEYEALKQELDNIKKLDYKADCPTCKRPLEEYFPHLVKASEEKLLLKASEWKTLKDWEFDKVSKEFDSLEKEISSVKALLESLKNEEKEFIKSNENKLNLEKNILENNLNLEKNKKELIVLEGNLKKIEFNGENYEKIKAFFYEANTKINTKQKELNDIKQNILTIEFSLKNLEKKLTDFKDDKKQIDNFVEEVNNLSLKKQIMSDYIIYLLGHLKPRIEDLASEYFSIITDWKYFEITLDDDYNILIDGKNLDLYSGGERDLANLCLRLSLGQNLTSSKWNPINFLVLDEVLASQDKERQQNILINLKKLENKFSQIILISHLEEIKDLATNLIEIKALNREESVVNYY